MLILMVRMGPGSGITQKNQGQVFSYSHKREKQFVALNIAFKAPGADQIQVGYQDSTGRISRQCKSKEAWRCFSLSMEFGQNY